MDVFLVSVCTINVTVIQSELSATQNTLEYYSGCHTPGSSVTHKQCTVEDVNEGDGFFLQ